MSSPSAPPATIAPCDHGLSRYMCPDGISRVCAAPGKYWASGCPPPAVPYAPSASPASLGPCEHGQSRFMCPDGVTETCGTPGKYWAYQCPPLPSAPPAPIAPCTNGMSRYLCPDGKTETCAPPGKYWAYECPSGLLESAPPPRSTPPPAEPTTCTIGQTQYTCPGGQTQVCAIPGEYWVYKCPPPPPPPCPTSQIQYQCPDGKTQVCSIPGEYWANKCSKSIVENAIATPTLSTLVSVLTMPKYKKVLDALSSAGPFTVFAPTNQAFAAANVDVNNVEVVSAVLLYHVISGSVKSTDLAATQQVATLGGKRLTITKDAKGVMINGLAKVITADVLSSNGVVHIIDKVLLPPAVPAACPSGQIQYQCPDGKTQVCAIPGEYWAPRCPAPPPACPNGQRQYTCPDNDTTVCAYPGTNWGAMCPTECPSDQRQYTCPDGNTQICAYPGTNWGVMCPPRQYWRSSCCNRGQYLNEI